MKELSYNEVSYVSGAGIFTSVGSELGSFIGGSIDTIAGLFGKTANPTFKTSGGLIGKGIGELFDVQLTAGAQDIFTGIKDGIASVTSLLTPAAAATPAKPAS